MPQQIQLRTGTAAQWTAANPILLSGERGYESDTGKWKTGNGVATWDARPYDTIPISGLKTVAGQSLVGIGDVSAGPSVELPVMISSTINLGVIDPGVVYTSDGNAPAGANERIIVNTNLVLTPGARVVKGYAAMYVYMNGTNTVDLTAFNVVGGDSLLVSKILTGQAGRLYSLYFGSPLSPPALPQVSVADLGAVDLVLPVISAVSVSNSTRTVLNCTTSETIKSPMPTTMPFAVDAGHPLTGTPVYVDPTHFNLTTSTAFAAGETPRLLSMAAAAAVNPIQDLSGNLLAPFSALAIVNNVIASARADNFSRADTTVGLGTPSDGGSAYVLEQGSAFGIIGGKAYCTVATGDNITSLETNNLDAIQTFAFDCGIQGSPDYAGILVRFLNVNNYLSLSWDSGNQRIVLAKMVNGVFTNNIIVSPSALFSVSAQTLLRIALSGNTIAVSINGTLVSNLSAYTITDATLRTGTKFALRAPAGNKSRFLGVS